MVQEEDLFSRNLYEVILRARWIILKTRKLLSIGDALAEDVTCKLVVMFARKMMELNPKIKL